MKDWVRRGLPIVVVARMRATREQLADQIEMGSRSAEAPVGGVAPDEWGESDGSGAASEPARRPDDDSVPQTRLVDEAPPVEALREEAARE
jgi:hypothetical protein